LQSSEDRNARGFKYRGFFRDAEKANSQTPSGSGENISKLPRRSPLQSHAQTIPGVFANLIFLQFPIFRILILGLSLRASHMPEMKIAKTSKGRRNKPSKKSDQPLCQTGKGASQGTRQVSEGPRFSAGLGCPIIVYDQAPL
jgi:hypothetical protein